MSDSHSRKRLYTLLQVGHTDLKQNLCGWDDEQYRELLARCGASEKNGKFSATTMTVKELEKALNELKRLGFKPGSIKSSSVRNTGDWRGPRIKKLNAMWIALADIGAVNDRSESAMQRWCSNHIPGLVKLNWATTQQLNQAVEMMKGMLRQRAEPTE